MFREPESDGRLRVGLVGLGSLGIRLGREFDSLFETDLVAIADVDEAGLTAAGREFDIPQSSQYREYETMLDEQSLDAVAIATPNGLHYDQATAALNRDLHVLCEKPLATTVEDAHALLERAEASEKVVMLGYQRHLNPAFIAGRERWALGNLDPTFITGEITHDWREYYEEMTDWRMDPELSGGGHLLNVGTHIIDAILWTTGLTPTHVTATVEFHDEDQLFDKQSSIIVEFENGAVANIADTGVVPRTREHIHIWDDEGAVYFEGREWDERTSYTIDTDGTEHVPYPKGRGSKAGAFVESIVNETEPPSTARDAFWATVVTMAAYESGRRNERLELVEHYPFLANVSR
ncbi:Gfo/Idh/MocA family protein [Haloprofundus salilacus]|uniref:Gfo/Idh/MocA family protein n=1 Tax=Haloprofundus salilacus TaxID=2876190 RepID=UPI001CCAADCD|nr:Gfo/Idh/MocA family oxidoreductase [Haloprofundus salilacus]